MAISFLLCGVSPSSTRSQHSPADLACLELLCLRRGRRHLSSPLSLFVLNKKKTAEVCIARSCLIGARARIADSVSRWLDGDRGEPHDLAGVPSGAARTSPTPTSGASSPSSCAAPSRCSRLITPTSPRTRHGCATRRGTGSTAPPPGALAYKGRRAAEQTHELDRLDARARPARTFGAPPPRRARAQPLA